MSDEGVRVTVGELGDQVRKEFTLVVTTAGSLIIFSKGDSETYVYSDNMTTESEEIVNLLEDAGML